MKNKFQIKGVEIVRTQNRAPNNPYKSLAEAIRIKYGNEGVAEMIEILKGGVNERYRVSK